MQDAKQHSGRSSSTMSSSAAFLPRSSRVLAVADAIRRHDSLLLDQKPRFEVELGTHQHVLVGCSAV